MDSLEPETKRIRRSELRSPSPSPPPDITSVPLSLDLTFVAPPANPSPAPSSPTSLIDFPLFSSAPSARLCLRSPTPPPTSEALWDVAAHSRKRPLSHYLLTPSEAAQRRIQLGAVLVTSDQIITQSKVAWPGCMLPWKVVHITDASAREGTQWVKGGRKRPGKKKRIKIRVAREKEKSKREARERSLAGKRKWEGLSPEEKEKREREEKTRRNREKKVKKRAREKAKKQMAGEDKTPEVGVANIEKRTST